MIKPVYDSVTSIQQAINMAVAENRVVRFFWPDSNAEIKRSIIDKKNCKLLKPDKESKEIAILPPGIDSYDFEAVDTRIILTDRKLVS
jgi:hypothetical protein